MTRVIPDSAFLPNAARKSCGMRFNCKMREWHQLPTTHTQDTKGCTERCHCTTVLWMTAESRDRRRAGYSQRTVRPQSQGNFFSKPAVDFWDCCFVLAFMTCFSPSDVTKHEHRRNMTDNHRQSQQVFRAGADHGRSSVYPRRKVHPIGHRDSLPSARSTIRACLAYPTRLWLVLPTATRSGLISSSPPREESLRESHHRSEGEKENIPP